MDAAMNRDAYSPASFNSSVLLPVLFSLLQAAIVVAAEAVPEQAAVVDAFARHTVQHKAICDEAGNVIKLAISNHTAFWKGGPAAPPDPMPERVFQAGIVKLNHLEAIAIEKQNLGDASYAMLGDLKKLRDVRLHYMHADAGATPDAPLFINRLPLPLEVLEIKHNFSIKGGCMDRLKPQPELRKLELDTGYAGPACVEFIKQSPKIENLQIHRTTINDAQLQEIFTALPELEILLVRPSGQKRLDNRITGRSLRGIIHCAKLRLLILGIEWKEFPYEGGLEVLTRLPKLEKVVFAPSDIEGFSLDDAAIQQLHRARPDVEIRVGQQSLGGTEGRETEQEDADWNWDGGVTTHG